MKVIVVIALGVLAVLLFTGGLKIGFGGDQRTPKPHEAVGGVNAVFEKALSANQPARAGTAAGKLNAQCALRERRLARLRRPRSLSGIRAYALRMLGVLQAHSRRAAEPPEVAALDVEHQRIIQRVARAAGRSDYRTAQAQAMALRELAGRANATFMRLGLTNCVLRATGMPV